MAEAKLYKGRAIVAYVGDTAIDSEGNAIEGAPKPPKDTDPSKQPGSLAAEGALTPAQEIGREIAAALRGQPSPSATAQAVDDETDEDEADGLPTLAEMEAHLAGIDSADEVKELRKSDKRKGAKALYKARLDELEG